MKAPDKIYIRTGMSGLLYGSKEKSFETDAEYIRKDTLLEWAKKELETRRNTGDDYFYPAIVALNDLIEKLNSL